MKESCEMSSEQSSIHGPAKIEDQISHILNAYTQIMVSNSKNHPKN